jgi:predicted nucleic acid-binding protein
VKYFFDTNIIIDLCQNNEEAKKIFKEIALEDESEIFVNRLVTLESLRTIHYSYTKRFRDAVRILDFFETLNIKQEIYDDAIAFSRFSHSKGVKLKGKCEAIDFLHFVTAKYYSLIIVSNDRDLDKLENVYEEFKKL